MRPAIHGADVIRRAAARRVLTALRRLPPDDRPRDVVAWLRSHPNLKRRPS